MRQARRHSLLVPGLMLILTVVGLVALIPAHGANCGAGVGPCSCGDRVITNTALGGSDPVLRQLCPCHGLVVASGVTLDIGGTIQWTGPGFCNDPNVFYPSGVLIEDGAADVVIKHGRTVGFLRGVAGGAVTSCRITGLQLLNQIHFGVYLGPYADNQMNTIEHNVVRGSEFLGILVHGTLNTVCVNRVEDSSLGISAQGSENTVCRNVISRAASTGIEVGGDNNTVSQNRVQQSGGLGAFSIYDSGNRFTDNIAVDNTGNGFFTAHSAGGNSVFQRNIANYNDGYGFADLSGGNVHEDNLCTGNALGDSSPPGLCR